MKKIFAIVMAVLALSVLLLPVVAMAEDESVERSIIVIPSKEELPDATAESPDFVFVQDESVVYVKIIDDNGNPVYIPETELDQYGYVVTPEQTWWMGTKDKGLTFKSTAPYAKFVDVYVDGKLVAKENYKDYEGSTMIDLTPEYLESLGVGDYTITILSNDGSGSVPFHILDKQAPTPAQTGDSSNTGMWAAIALITLGAIGVVALTLVKTRKSAEK